MGNNCLYCGTYFEAKRSNKKYCSDNCKQMAYFTRNGFILSGTNTSAPIIKNELISEEKVQEHPIAIEPLNVKEENSVIVKYDLPTEPENVKYDNHTVKYAKEKIASGSTEVESTPQEKVCVPISFNQTLAHTAKGSVDYCIPCPNPFINGFVENTVLKIHENKIEQTPVQKNETHQPIDSGEPLPNPTKNETLSKKEEQKKIASEIIQEEKPEEKPYQSVSGKFIRQFEFYVFINYEHKKMLQEPNRFWSYEKAKQVTWINIRFRCLIESLIRLSNYSHIDKHTLLCVADAFDKLCNSYAYKNLPSNYPYKKLIAELSDKVVSMAKREQNEKTLPFKLSLQRKAHLAAIRYDMLHTVSSIKFSELDFTEEQNSGSTSPSSVNTFSDEEKTEPKKWRVEFEEWKRKRNNAA